MQPRTATPRIALLLLAISPAACGSDPVGPELEVIEEVEFAPSLGIDLAQMTRTNFGLYYQDLVEGQGDPATTGDLAYVTYRGWLRTGTSFGEGTFDFIVDSGQVIQGFNETVRGMAAGGLRKSVVPPGLAYGSIAQPGIPAGSILVFEIALDSIR